MDIGVAELRSAADHDPALIGGVRIRSAAPRAADPVRAELLPGGEDLVGQHARVTLRALRTLLALRAGGTSVALRAAGPGSFFESVFRVPLARSARFSEWFLMSAPVSAPFFTCELEVIR
jgi:hypothetical protein